MMLDDVQPVVEVETVRLETLHAGVEMKLVALLLARMGQKPVDQLLTRALETRARCGHQIVHIENLSPRQTLRDPESADHLHEAAVFEADQLITVPVLLSTHALHELRFAEMRAK